MAKIWIENGKTACCSELCNLSIDMNNKKVKKDCPRYGKCQEIESPVKLQQDKSRFVEVMEQIRDIVSDEDILSPTIPEYIEHHEAIQNILKFIDGKIKEMEG